jgi:hypothetical protein
MADKNKTETWIAADKIFMIQKDPNNLLQTIVVTTMNGPNGPLGYAVMDSPATLIGQVSHPLGVTTVPFLAHPKNDRFKDSGRDLP